MWIVIIFACMTSGVCGFIDSPPVNLQDECKTMLDKANKALDSDPTVSVYNSTCIRIKMRQV